ncbi:SH3 domain-containing protein [Sphingobacterium corticis]|uniref:SH3 domain-containing protein n=1 Tax=Sphingobacterium corticis TaxID=1812823 RepID=A0ABW5NI48_9SPHI
MALTDKYADLIALAQSLKVENLAVEEKDHSLFVSGLALSADALFKMWDLYNRIDPNHISEDLRLHLKVKDVEDLKLATVRSADEEKVAIRLGPSVNQPILDELDQEEQVSVLGITNQNWAFVKTSKNIEGFCYIDYLSI